MKILHTVESYYPSVGGMQAVVRVLSEELIKLGHQVVVAAKKDKKRGFKELNGVKIEEFDISGNAVSGYKSPAGEIERYKEFVLESDFDIIANFAAQQWATDILLPELKNVKAKKVFIPTGFSGLFSPAYKDYFEKMKSWMKEYDLNIFLSNDYRDINFARENNITKNITIPNGAGEKEFLAPADPEIREKLGIPRSNFLIVLIGSHTGLKGHKEAIEIFKKADIKKSTLLIIGNRHRLLGRGGACWLACKAKELFFSGKDKQLLIKDLARPDTISVLKSAQLFLFPSNIECSPIVLFEAMAARLPFLTTDVGNAKEIISWSNGGLLLPTIKTPTGLSFAEINESAKTLERVCQDKELREKLSADGFDAWREKFTWEKIAKQYEEAYGKLLKDG